MEKLEAAATPGAWYIGSGTGYPLTSHGISRIENGAGCGPFIAEVYTEGNIEADAEFIAASRAFVPWAIAEIRRLKRWASHESNRCESWTPEVGEL